MMPFLHSPAFVLPFALNNMPMQENEALSRRACRRELMDQTHSLTGVRAARGRIQQEREK
ncbi:MAG: hypothetical protein ACP5I1_05910 [Candidatus Hinthialibacter sp.]